MKEKTGWVLIFFLLLVGCQSRPLIIGFMAGLTGSASEMGISARKGVELAVQEINARGGIHGRQVILEVKNDEGSSEIAQQHLLALREKGIFWVIGPMTTGVMKGIFENRNQSWPILVSPTVSGTSFSGIQDYFFRVISSHQRAAEILAETAFNSGERVIFAVYDQMNKAHHQEYLQNFKLKFESLGGKVFPGFSYSGEPDALFDKVSIQVTKRPDSGVLYLGGGLHCALLSQYLEKRGFQGHLFSSAMAMTPDLIQYGGKGIQKVLITGYFDENSENPRYLSMKKSYEKSFAQSPSYFSVFAYEAFQVLAHALQRSETLTQEAVQQSLSHMGTIQGLQGNFTLNAWGDANREIFLFTVKDQKFFRVPLLKKGDRS